MMIKKRDNLERKFSIMKIIEISNFQYSCDTTGDLPEREREMKRNEKFWENLLFEFDSIK